MKNQILSVTQHDLLFYLVHLLDLTTIFQTLSMNSLQTMENVKQLTKLQKCNHKNYSI